MCLFSILASTVTGTGGIVCLFFIFFFESCAYPIIFGIATADLGSYMKVGSGILAVGVSGASNRPYLNGTRCADVSASQVGLRASTL